MSSEELVGMGSLRRRIGAMGVTGALLAVACGSGSAAAADLVEPPVFTSQNGGNQSGRRMYTSNHLVVAGPTDAAGIHQLGGIFNSQIPGVSGAALPAGCATLPRGHRRRLFFGFSDVSINNTFALGYEEVDERGNVVPGSQKPSPDHLQQFDPSVTTICLPLGPGQTPAQETWELIQLSTENHNFHLHQTRFVMTGRNGGVIQDNFPLGVAVPDRQISDQVFNNQNGVCTIQ
jgi:L-ascorbate oxidase